MIAHGLHRPARPLLGLGCSVALAAVLLVGRSLAQPASTLPPPPTAAAAARAQAINASTAGMLPWLQTIDAGKYGESWDEASVLFQKAVTREKWDAQVEGARAPLGSCKSRVLANANLVPKGKARNPRITGDLVVAQYKSSFDNLAAAIETVSFVREPSGEWKASGYFIKPAML